MNVKNIALVIGALMCTGAIAADLAPQTIENNTWTNTNTVEALLEVVQNHKVYVSGGTSSNTHVGNIETGNNLYWFHLLTGAEGNFNERETGISFTTQGGIYDLTQGTITIPNRDNRVQKLTVKTIAGSGFELQKDAPVAMGPFYVNTSAMKANSTSSYFYFTATPGQTVSPGKYPLEAHAWTYVP